MCSNGKWALLVEVCPSFLFFFFFTNFWGLETLTKFNTEIRIYRTKFGIVTLIHVFVQELLRNVEKGQRRSTHGTFPSGYLWPL